MPAGSLERFYNYLRPKDLTQFVDDPAVTQLNADPSKNRSDGALEFLLELLVHSRSDGVAGSDDIKSQIEEFARSDDGKNLKKYLRCYTSVGIVQGLGTEVYETAVAIGINVPLSRKSCVVKCDVPYLSMNVRNVNKITTFMKAIPSIELARCMPYIDVRMQLPRAPLDHMGRAVGTSLIKFFSGGAPVDQKSADKLLAGVKKQALIGKKAIDVTQTAMDLFTSPQTLLNLDEVYVPSNRYVPVLDKTRPLMSIENFSVNVVSMTGPLAYKTAKLEIILHDRSRLTEIADLIKPDFYAKTSIDIEYGWQHPDNDVNSSVYGEFMNTLKCREIYGVKSATYALDPAGQIKISLDLAMKGATETHAIKVGGTTNLQNVLEEITELSKEVRTQMKLDFMPDLRASQLLEAASRGELPSDLEGNKLQEAVQKLKNVLAGKSPDGKSDNGKGQPATGQINEAAKQLSDKITEAFSLDPDDKDKKKVLSLKERHAQHIKRRISNKLDLLNKDAYVKSPADAPGFEKFYEQNVAGKPLKYVSLSQVMSVFVLGPAVSQYDGIEEAQLFFYTFGSTCGAASSRNIGDFPIDVGLFKELFSERLKDSGASDMSIYDFLTFVSDNFLKDYRSDGYGLAELYMPRTAKQREPAVDKKKYKDTKAFTSALDEKLKQYGGTFAFPVVHMHLETLPRMRIADSGSTVYEGSKILRLHVFDKQMQPYGPVDHILKQLTLKPDAFVSDGALKEQRGPFIAKIKELSEKLSSGGFDVKIETKTGGDGAEYVHVDGNIDVIKRAITQIVPTITWGTNNSMIKSISVSSQQNQLIAAGNMKSQGRSNPVEPNGSGVGGVPMLVYPGELTMVTVGCPLVSFAQKFFFDFGTGTTLDNMYIVTSLSHTIASGKFETSWKLSFNDAYPRYTSFVRAIQRVNEDLKSAVK
jgi:hypothetical protein